ncbi:hypothetical protein [Sapientia aquatica]|uniref:Uncharacterized protein n=1 Tax=Sapientia aquatica TaxID=1549640 RepID=A0A4R5W0T1_9BURK|nr:hypothetical protein [Sapientia aquatica]TDK65646.1 hypothetical protein E2I14_11930 [Sapientia aquatica]
MKKVALVLVLALSGSFTHAQSSAELKGWYLSSVIPVGSLIYSMAYGQQTVSNIVASAKTAVGVSYWLSKLTSVYANYAYDSKIANMKDAFEIGISRAF